MRNFSNVTLLELVEEYALNNNLIMDEDTLGECFDNEVAAGLIEQFGIKGVEFTDEAMISEAFSAFTDGLQRCGRLHAEQVKNYDYVGKYSDI